MFERYTEKARRVIFFARYEASQFGSPYIETEHLLLGLLREDKALANRFLRSHAAIESIRKQIEAHTTVREKVSTSVDLPLSHECKRVLAYGAEEAERLSHKHIGTEHLLLGLLREEKSFAAEILHERGLRLSAVREEIARSASEKTSASRPKESSLLAEFSRDLTESASALEQRIAALEQLVVKSSASGVVRLSDVADVRAGVAPGSWCPANSSHSAPASSEALPVGAVGLLAVGPKRRTRLGGRVGRVRTIRS